MVRPEERVPCLLYLLEHLVRSRSCLIFCSTRYVVDFLVALLAKLSDLPVEGLHGKMDSEARVEIMKKFSREGGVLVVTDLAARGLDLPFIEVVLHFDYPANSKIFVHRSGRTARAGRHG